MAGAEILVHATERFPRQIGEVDVAETGGLVHDRRHRE
jgi:hypothetical protein